MKHSDPNLDSLRHDLAGRFRAAGQLFNKLGSEEVVQQLLDSLISGDASAFNRLIEEVDFPSLPPGLQKCVIYREWIDTVVCTKYTTEVCRLRLDLTPNERLQYFMIAVRYRPMQPTAATMVTLSSGENPEIPPGPFLDELKANNLVTCKLEEKSDCTVVLGFGPRELVCP